LEPASRPKFSVDADVADLLADVALLVHLDRVDARVRPLVLVLGLIAASNAVRISVSR
jgi:hypothetical protein